MSKDEAKAEVARLLLERAEMKRLGTDLSPDKLMLLKRLMYRLGMNNVKLQRREALLRLARRIAKPEVIISSDPERIKSMVQSTKDLKPFTGTKGLLHIPTGKVHLWNTIGSDGEPHHEKMAKRLGMGSDDFAILKFAHSNLSDDGFIAESRTGHLSEKSAKRAIAMMDQLPFYISNVDPFRRLARRIGVKRYGRVTPETLKKLAEGLSKNPENEDIRHAYADEHELAGNPGVAELIRKSQGTLIRDHDVASHGGKWSSNVDHVAAMSGNVSGFQEDPDLGTKWVLRIMHVGGPNPYYPDRPNMKGGYGLDARVDEEEAHRIASTSPGIEGSDRLLRDIESRHPWLRNRKYARTGVKRYSEPTQPVQPSGPLAPWRNPAPQSAEPKKTTKALQALKEKAALVPVTDEPLPQPVRPANTSRIPSRRRQVDDSVRNVPGGFSLGTRNGRRAFLNYLSDTGEDSDFQHRVDEEVRYQADQYEPDIDQDRMRQIAEDNNWTPDEMIGHISQYHPEAEDAIREWHRIHAYRPMDHRIAEETRQPSLFDPNDGQGPPIRHRFDLHDELADPASTWYSDSLMNYLQTYHPELNHRAINNTLNALDDQRQSEMQDGIERAEQNDREWYEQNMDTSDIEDQILEQMHDEMEQEGRWEDRGEEPEEDDEDQTPQLNVVNSNEPPQQLPTAEPKPLTGGPQFGRWYGDDRVHTYRFQTPSGRPFTIDIGHYNEGRTKIDNLTFNDDRHSFDDTGKGEAAAVFDQVSQAVAAYMQAKKPHILTFSAATTDGQATGGKSRQNLYTALIKRIGQIDPNYAAAAIPSPGGGKNFVVFDRSMVDDVERMIQSKFGGRQVPIEPIILSRRHALLRRYAKIDGHVQAHPLVQGFPIENALRHLANDPNNHPSIRELAKVAVTGGKDGDGSNIPMALWALHDELHQHKHPAKDWYNWMSAADKIGLDAHTYRALKEYAQAQLSQMPGIEHGDEWHWSPESFAVTAAHGLHFKDARRTAVANAIKARVQELSSGTDPKDIEESIRRHHWRAMKHWRQSNVGGTDPTTDAEEERIGRFDLAPYKEVSGKPEYMKAAEKATRYRRILRRLARKPSGVEGLKRYQMVAGDFLDALRRIRLSDQHAIRKTTEEIAAKLGLKPASTVDALHNSPAYSVPGVAQAIYANASPESVHAAAAWYGLTGNIPGMAVFHVRPDGPDMLHRFRMQGSGHDMLQKLDKAGITDRVLVPHRKGFDLLIPDRGGKMRDRVRKFTQRQKTELQSSRGHFKLIGAADQAKAREMFRNTITDQERKAV